MSVNILDALTANVLDDGFKRRMAQVAENVSLSCVAYGGLLYDFDFFINQVSSNLSYAVTSIKPKAGLNLLPLLLSRYLAAYPTCSLFAHNFVSVENPFPSIRSVDTESIRIFIRSCASMPLNLLIADGTVLHEAGGNVLAVADICDGDAWLLVASGNFELST